MEIVRKILVVLILLALPSVMLHHLWSDPLSAAEDDVVYYYPLRKMVGDSLRQGQLPLYNAREAAGMPLLADPQTAIGHPTTWLFAVLDAKAAYTLSLLIAFSLAGGGAYLYLRRLGLVRPAAMFGAVAFMFCGFMVGHRVHLAMITAAAMLPWGLWCIEGLRNRPHSDNVTDSASAFNVPPAHVNRVAAALWLVAVAYLLIAAGHWPTLIHVGLVWVAYMLFRARPLAPALVLAGLAVALATAANWPQIEMTRELMAQATRQKIEIGVAGENSFLPTSAILALFPFFQGNRHPNFFSQPWWGSWHLCEMLGYVGLITLALAIGCIWRLFRRKPRRYRKLAAADPVAANRQLEEYRHPFTPLVRCWTWLLILCGIFMAGYYLPTYYAVYEIPVLSVVRCPARMVLAVDLGLATLAALAVHAIATASAADGRVHRLARSCRNSALLVLPLTMAAGVAFFYHAGKQLKPFFADKLPEPFVGGASSMIDACYIGNPAIYVPIILMALTAATMTLWVWRRQRAWAAAAGAEKKRGTVQSNGTAPSGADLLDLAQRRALLSSGRSEGGSWMAVLLVALLLADLYTITGFVDVPSDDASRVDPDVSPAAAWLVANRGEDLSRYRVWGLSSSYHQRSNELLLPKTSGVLGVSTIGNYGPFHSPYLTQMLGSRAWGCSAHWESLLRRNHVLSGYGVKYIVTAQPQYRRVLESVTVPRKAAAPGPNLLGPTWQTERASVEGGVLSLQTFHMAYRSEARQDVAVPGGRYYRVALDCRSADGGPAFYVHAGVLFWRDGQCVEHGQYGLTIEAEQVSGGWRHYERTFYLPPVAPELRTFFSVYSLGSRRLEVRNVTLQEAAPEQPVMISTRLSAGDRVYNRLVELPPLHAGQPPVAIYENRLAEPLGKLPMTQPSGELVEKVKWARSGGDLKGVAWPDISMAKGMDPSRLYYVSAAAGALYLLLVVLMLVRTVRRVR